MRLKPLYQHESDLQPENFVPMFPRVVLLRHVTLGLCKTDLQSDMLDCRKHP